MYESPPAVQTDVWILVEALSQLVSAVKSPFKSTMFKNPAVLTLILPRDGRHVDGLFFWTKELCVSPSASDAGASVGTEAGACAGGLLSWTGLLGIPWKRTTPLPITHTNTHSLRAERLK